MADLNRGNSEHHFNRDLFIFGSTHFAAYPKYMRGHDGAQSDAASVFVSLNNPSRHVFRVY